MNLLTSRMLPPIRRPQIFGIAVVLAVFILIEFVVGDHDKATVVLSNDAQSQTTR
jgi:hypothetical protein